MKTQQYCIRFLPWTLILAFFATFAAPLGLAAQDKKGEKGEQHHYKFIDLGTLGGPNSYFSSSGFGAQVLNSQGMIAGYADTPFPDPYAPNCFDLDCHLAHAFRWQDGISTDLGALPGTNNSAVTAINAAGDISGFSDSGQIDPLTGLPEFEGVLWKSNRIVPLGTLGGNESLALALNDRDQAIGAAANTVPDTLSMFGWGTQTRAFLWEKGAMQDLGTLGGPDAGPSLGTMAINQSGEVSGASYTNSIPDPILGVPTTHPFLWEKEEGMEDLGTLGGTLGVVSFLNNRGQVVGQSYLSGNLVAHAFLWDKHDGLTDLGTLGGSFSNPHWITDAGEIVGGAGTPNDEFYHATIWQQGRITDLGTVNNDGCSDALATNSYGQIVGQSFVCDYSAAEAFIWDDGTMVDLNTLIPSGSDLHLVFAANINDRGEIVGVGVPLGDPPNTDLYGRLFLLIPCDEHHPGLEGCDYSLVDAPTAQASVATRRLLSAQQSTQPSPYRLRNPLGWRILGQRPASHD